MKRFSNILTLKISHIDWILFFSVLLIVGAGLVTMNSFDETNFFFWRQLVWLAISVVAFFVVSMIDVSFLKRTQVILWLYGIAVGLLAILFILGSVVKGAQSWFSFGLFAFQPSEFGKIILIILLAKYFSKRHIEIRNVRHIIVSGAYAFFLFGLVLLQPDFGSALIIFLIWFGMVMVSGLSKKHFFTVMLVGIGAFVVMWSFVFQDYQRTRISSFLNPLEDVQGAGYNAYQSMVTVGSGQILGKGIGYGTQSRLQFLPEYQTDFVFAAFSEEWGLVGVSILFFLYAVVIWRIIYNSSKGKGNFETLYGLGLSILLVGHFMVNVGMNIGLLPVTGITVPMMSYGGTHLLITFIGFGILMAMRKNSRAVHREVIRNEFVGY